jgi:hypothetical protein
MRTPSAICGLLLTILFTACGGGTGGSEPTPAPPAISYGPSGSNTTQFTFVAQSAVSLSANNTGGPVATWSVTPALPAGLEFNSATGAITGTPGSFAPISVTVTAANAGGSSQVTLSLRSGSLVLNMGATCFTDTSGYFQYGLIALTSTRMLTQDCGEGEQHWALWNYATGAVLSQGVACPVDTCAGRYPGGLPAKASMAGPIAAVPYTSAGTAGPIGFQIVNASDGSIAATIVPSGGVTWWRVASDGSYVCGAVTGNGNLTVWAPDGSVIATRTGNYSSAAAYCAPGQVLVAKGPAGSTVIETISVPGGTSSVSPAFAGAFNSWFSDGSAFLSNVSTNVYVYSPAAAQLDFRVLPTSTGLAGWGPWFWTADGTTLNIYKVGASATPTASYAAVSIAPSGPTIAITGTPFSIIDLSGATPTQTPYSPPFSDLYAAVSASQWVVAAGGNGLVVDGASLTTTPRYFGYGRMLALAGSQSRFAVATSRGKILVYNTAALSLETTLNAAAQQLAMSGDGSILAILSYQPGNSVQTVSLPSGAPINTWSYPSAPGAAGITLSVSGALLGQNLSSGMSQVTSSSGGPVLWSGTGNVQLSLDDALIAASSNTNNATTMYKNYAQSAAVSGVGVGWLQNDDLLVDAFPIGSTSPNSGAVYDSMGIKQSGPALPALIGPIQC